uniref:Uncharacterized protein n=1 Tax=Kalanchoe fedtschenkoi TaxID=63787 RepID=A0A7N0U841_KALFE
MSPKLVKSIPIKQVLKPSQKTKRSQSDKRPEYQAKELPSLRCTRLLSLLGDGWIACFFNWDECGNLY